MHVHGNGQIKTFHVTVTWALNVLIMVREIVMYRR